MSISATVAVKLATAAATADKSKLIQIIFYPLIGLLLLSITVISFVFTPSEDDVYKAAADELATDAKIRGDIPIAGIRTLHIIFTEMTMEATIHEVKKFIEEYFVIEATDEETGETYFRFCTIAECMERIREKPFSFDSDTLSLLQLAFEQSFDAAWEGFHPDNEQGGNPSPLLPIPQGSLASPCDGSFSSQWGYRTHPVSKEYELHTGIDIAGEWHRPIYAVADGTVQNVNLKASGYGNYIQIKHELGGVTFYSFYAHLSRIDIKQGQHVSSGERLGLEGGDQQKDPNPGTTSGHHLHLELRVKPNRNSTVDPFPYLPQQ